MEWVSGRVLLPRHRLSCVGYGGDFWLVVLLGFGMGKEKPNRVGLGVVAFLGIK